MKNSKNDLLVFKIMSGVLILIGIVSWFLPIGYGIRCKDRTFQWCFVAIILFQVVWTFYLLQRLKHVKLEGGWRYYIYLFIKHDKKDYDKQELQTA